MNKFLLSLFCLALFVSSCGSEERQAPPPPEVKIDVPPRIIRVLVMPFQDRNSFNETEYVSMGLAVFATARLEELSRSLDPAKGLKIEAVVGPETYSAEAAKLRADRHAPVDAGAAFAEAKRVGATHILTGSYGGRVEKWSLTVELYEVAADQLYTAGSSEETRKIFAWAKDVPKPKRAGVQSPTIHAMFGSLASAAFAKGGIALPDEVVTVLSTPQSPDIVAFIRLSEAYRALLLGDGSDQAIKIALDKAEAAVRVWPDYQIALRLYAGLLWQRGKTESARKQFANALKRDPSDVRALVALGRLEVSVEEFAAALEALLVAVKLQPDKADIHYWIGAARSGLGQTAEAIASYERSRELDPAHIDTHRALAGLYANDQRYADAAKELSIVVEAEPANLDAVFLLAACLRADEKPIEAIRIYFEASSRFPDEAKLHKFRGDLLEDLLRHDEASLSYELAKSLAPKDGRWRDSSLRYGIALLDEIIISDAFRREVEKRRRDFQMAVNDATWDLSWNKKSACEAGRAGSSYLLAKKIGNQYDSLGLKLRTGIRSLRTSIKNGEGAALTPDEIKTADELLVYEDITTRDMREMRAGYAELKRLMSALDCVTDPAESTASIDDINERNNQRYVVMPEPKDRDMSGISPVVPPDSRRVVKFSIENKSTSDYVLVMDGRAHELAISAGSQQTYSVTMGEHSFCLLPKERVEECGRPGSPRRKAKIHEGWTAIIQEDL